MVPLIQKICLPLGKRLLDGIKAIDAGGAGIALVLDGEGRLVGTLTDGDVRRALLHGASVESSLDPYIQRKFISVGVETGRAEVLDLMQALVLTQVPVVDKERKLVGLHLLREIVGSHARPHRAVIMAGGRGTRLAPLTERLPKPMVQVAGRPILERLVLHLVGFGVRGIYLAVNYLAEVIVEHFGDGSRFGCQIEYLRESEPMGTGGALSLLPQRPDHPLLVLNGDLVTQVNIADMIEFHESGGYVATMGIRQYAHEVPFGCVEVGDGRVKRMEEKPLIHRLVNAGVYVVNPTLLSRVPRASYPITSMFDECIERGEPVGAFEIQEDWLDVGHRGHLRQAQEGH
jgi:dTDP-glucose pyrophosphorylase